MCQMIRETSRTEQRRINYAVGFIINIIFIVPEDTLEYMLGAILGGGYGILMVIAFVAILYGIYKFFSDLWNGR